MKLCPLSASFAILALGLLSSCSSLPTFSATEISTSVRVTDRGGWIVMEPTIAPAQNLGLMFYPGGFVHPEAYELALVPIVQAGYPVVIVKMPFDLAFLDSQKGLAARDAVPGVKRWVIGGHSLGGVAAAMVLDQHPEAFGGIIFVASYPAKDNDLSKRSVPALAITASNDGLATREKVAAAAGFLPRGTEQVLIIGGNHAQFANYGPQKGDGIATLDRDDQQLQVSRAVTAFLNKLAKRPWGGS